jgi:hypothetical protein
LKIPPLGVMCPAVKPSFRRPDAVDSGAPSPSVARRCGVTFSFQCTPGASGSTAGASTSTYASMKPA